MRFLISLIVLSAVTAHDGTATTVAAHDGTAATVAAQDAFPTSIGVIGVGTIGSALVRGVLAEPSLPTVPDIVLYDVNATKMDGLKKEFPNRNVTTAASGQEVLGMASTIVLALPGSVAESVIKELSFKDGQQVISLVVAIKYPKLQTLLGPRVDAAMAVPLPAISKRQGATLGIPPSPFAEALFASLGTYTAVTDVDAFTRLESASCFMGDLYKHQLTIQQWLVSHEVDPSKAAAYVGAVFATMTVDSKDATPGTFADLVASQTPGGLNEMVWKQQEAAGVYLAVNNSLDAVFKRNNQSRETSSDTLSQTLSQTSRGRQD